jgi:hypothetical protein
MSNLKWEGGLKMVTLIACLESIGLPMDSITAVAP